MDSNPTRRRQKLERHENLIANLPDFDPITVIASLGPPAMRGDGGMTLLLFVNPDQVEGCILGLRRASLAGRPVQITITQMAYPSLEATG